MYHLALLELPMQERPAKKARKAGDPLHKLRPSCAAFSALPTASLPLISKTWPKQTHLAAAGRARRLLNVVFSAVSATCSKWPLRALGRLGDCCASMAAMSETSAGTFCAADVLGLNAGRRKAAVLTWSR